MATECTIGRRIMILNHEEKENKNESLRTYMCWS